VPALVAGIARLNPAPIAIPSHNGPDIRFLQKRKKVAALDMRFQRYRKAEP
jgi:hypothetical protein